MNTLRPKLIEKEPVTSPDGGTRWFQTIKIPIVSPDGRANAVLGVAADITARKEAEDRLERRSEQLRAHHAALRALALSSPADLKTGLERILETASRTLNVARTGVWLLDAERGVLTAECVFDRGRLSDEPTRVFPKRDFPAYFRALAEERTVAAQDARDDPRTRELAATYLEPLGITSMLDVTILSHGTVIGVVCHEHRGPLRDWTIEEQDFAASIADIVLLALEGSKRLALEEQLRHAQKMEAIGLLAGGISHDFNNLLNIILGHGELAAKQLPAGHPATPHLDNIMTACSRAAALVRKILTFSRGRILRVEPVEFGGVLREFSTLLTRVLGEDVELQVTVADEPMIVEADRTQMEQILLNLCTNARQAMPQGGRLVLDARPVEGEGGSGPQVHLRVTDSGHGIDEATMSRLWEPFFTTKADGTGLGLSMVYGITRQHGGILRAESRVGHGSTFHVLLPLRQEPVADTPVASLSRERAGTGDDPPGGGRSPDPRARRGPAARARVHGPRRGKRGRSRLAVGPGSRSRRPCDPGRRDAQALGSRGVREDARDEARLEGALHQRPRSRVLAPRLSARHRRPCVHPEAVPLGDARGEGARDPRREILGAPNERAVSPPQRSASNVHGRIESCEKRPERELHDCACLCPRKPRQT